MNEGNVKKLKQLLDKQKEYQEQYQEEKRKFEETHLPLQQKLQELYEDIVNLKSDITEDALADYETNKLKDYIGGITIKIFKQVGYDDSDAIKWAIDTAQTHLVETKLNKTEFNKLAKVINLPFVTKFETPKVMFPSAIVL